MSTPARLVARTVAVDPAVDLLAVGGAGGVVFQRDGVGLAGRGVALRVAADEVDDTLGAIAVEDAVDLPGSGPIGFGARPFRPDEPWALVVPQLTVGRDGDGNAWATVVGTEEEVAEGVPALEPAGARTPGDGPTRFSVAGSVTPAQWCAAVAAATDRIRAGGLDKVVLSREVVVTADSPFLVDEVLGRLRDGFPGCFVFSVDGLVGASPELLVSRTDDVVRAQPMAGSTPRTGNPEVDAGRVEALLASPTYRHEHQVTIDVVHETLLPYCSYLDDEPEPSVVELPNVAHLATWVEGRLSHPPASVLELGRALHPTPAVSGRPLDASLAVIDELEPTPRGRYAGTVGWVDRRGNGVWAVSLRCAQLDGSTARLHAGCGLVADSQPEAELAESRAKLQVMLGALVRP